MTTQVAGIDLGGTKLLTRVLDPDNPSAVLVETRRDTPAGAAELVAAMADAVADVDRRLAAQGRSPVQALGVGAAGLVDRTGVMRHAPNLVGMDEYALGSALTSAIERPVVIDNDATAATMAEWQLGAARGVDDMVLVTLGTGIGAGLVSGGMLQRGAGGFAGEAGHMIVDPSGPPCPCGRRGCWERYASGNGLGRLARDAAAAGKAGHVVAAAGGDPDMVRGEHVAQAASAGDPEALAVIDDFAWWVALGASNLVAVLDSSMVVVAGGLVAMGDLLMVPVRRHFGDLLVSVDHRPPVQVVPAELGPEAGATGAWLAAEQLLANQR